MTTLHLRTSRGRSPWRRAFILIPILFGCFALSQTARAVSPAPDGGYPNGNTAEGTGALQSLTTGVWNTANGFQTLFHDTTGGQNTATGLQALFSNTTGGPNVATGIQALYNNTTGSKNTGTGLQALFSNKTGVNNVADGYRALLKNTVDNNTAIGAFALLSNTTGTPNTAVGANALFNNLIGELNNAVGDSALANNTTGSFNEALGSSALASNIQGVGNVAIGDAALSNVDSNFNTVVGFDAGQNLTSSSGLENIYIGDTAGTVDNTGFSPGNEAGVIRIGSFFSGTAACFINGISGVDEGGTVSVVTINGDGRLGTKPPVASSRRFKDEIKPMDKASEAILALKPVTFRYKKEIDHKGIPQFGLVAEDVEKVNPDLVTRDRDGKLYTVRYDAVNAMLLNEFLKEHKKVEAQQASISQLKSEMQTMVAQLKEQAAQIQKVSAQFEVNKPTPKMVLNNP